MSRSIPEFSPWKAGLLCTLPNVINNIDYAVFPLAMTMVGEELGIDNSYLQVLYFLPPLMGATFGLVSGLIGDRITPDRLLKLGLWVSGVSILLTSFCHTFMPLAM
ncbi:hypothetical protein KIPB_012098 [Kipferlia bialata]|uniref:Major facilitator superfamily (MFS) profile domain-containing protein n=1 Tax=Kipferlia bialata TaxID=797122 RepID=A0A9K3GNN6_9EUKA|nr:hypothetical protein KIPB_012098 [Kipferlia bialata]|eukprot:g12098.t1